MELLRVHLTDSPRLRDWVRLVGEIRFDAAPGQVHELWFEVPSEHAPCLSESANPWLAALLPLAARRGEPLRLGVPVDARLRRGAVELLHIWSNWYANMRVVEIESAGVSDQRPAPAATASMFSGGVDSFFTVIEEGRSPWELDSPTIDDLITLWGFDIPVDDAAAFLRMRDTLERAADTLGKRLVPVATNVRSAARLDYPWPLSHSGVLAAAGLLLERRYARVLIPSTHGYASPTFGASHPLTDPLFSTRHTVVVHHGSAYRRAQKLQRIASHPAVMQTLHVCVGSATDTNCGCCLKCYCTMLHLDVLGLLARYETFPVAEYRVARAGRIDSSGWEVRSYLEDVRAAARGGRHDIADAVTRGLRWTEAHHRRLRAQRFVAAKLRDVFRRQ